TTACSLHPGEQKCSHQRGHRSFRLLINDLRQTGVSTNQAHCTCSERFLKLSWMILVASLMLKLFRHSVEVTGPIRNHQRLDTDRSL
uniref:Uncharacterized protein n=1 Tax=Takifugu rubripes TaxID=31033 RepID=A0A674P7A9_TAKRU